jgi:Resolvase, N terminal domain
VAPRGLSSLAEPFLDTTSDFAEIVFAILGVAAKLERRRILERTARGRADAKANGVKFGRKPSLTPHQQKRGPRARRSWRDAAQRGPQLQCQSEHDFTAGYIKEPSNPGIKSGNVSERMKSRRMDIAIFWLPVVGGILLGGLAGNAWYGGDKILALWLTFFGLICFGLVAVLQIQQTILQSKASPPLIR